MEFPGKVEGSALAEGYNSNHIGRRKEKVGVDAGGFVTGGKRTRQVLSFEDKSSVERMGCWRVLAEK